MAAWQYIKGRWWIFVIATVPFVIIGAALIIFDTVADPSPNWDPPWYDSFLFLGIFFVVSPFIGMWLVTRKVRRSQRVEQEILARSVPGRATVISVTETGLYTNNVPEVDIVLDVSTDEHSEYRITHREHVGLLNLSRLLPGKEIEVRVDSTDRNSILLDL